MSLLSRATKINFIVLRINSQVTSLLAVQLHLVGESFHAMKYNFLGNTCHISYIPYYPTDTHFLLQEGKTANGSSVNRKTKSSAPSMHYKATRLFHSYFFFNHQNIFLATSCSVTRRLCFCSFNTTMHKHYRFF